MPACSTGTNDDTLRLLQTVEIILDSAKTDPTLINSHTSPHDIVHNGRLFKNLFEHEMLKAAFLYFFEGKIKFCYNFFLFNIINRLYNVAVLFHYSKLAIGEINNFIGVLNNRSSIRCNEIFPGTDTDHQWTSLTCNDDLVGFPRRDHTNPVCPINMTKSVTGSRFKVQRGITLPYPVDQVNQHLGIGIA